MEIGEEGAELRLLGIGLAQAAQDVGRRLVEGAQVTFKVVENFKGDKITVFKMKSKKRYSRTRGFRASLTKLEVVKVA